MAPWSIFTTFVALIAVVSCHPQYSGAPTDQVAQGSGVHSGAAISSSCYSSSYDCVPYFQCIDGVINTDGAGLIDLRIKPAATCINPEYPDVPAVCCLIPGGVATPSPLDTCPGLNECVNPNQCSANGYIITDGSGLIDIRAGQTTCWNGQAVGVCCTPPLPVLDTCPGHSYCSAKGCAGSALDGSNSWNPYTQGVGVWQQCALEFGNTGVCCDPPALNACPHDSACVVDGQCVGTALDPFDAFVNYGPNAGFFMKCNVGGISGVCCKQPILNECPIHSACVAHGTCLGEALDYQNSWINYIQTGSWRECGVGATSGICCKQPVLDVCPGGGVCVDHASCLGQGLNHLDSWIDYSTQGATWQQCGLGGSNGVCCKQPVKVLDYCPSGSVCTDQGNCATSALNYDNQFVSYATGGKYQECALSAGYNGICCQANQLIDRCPDSHCVEYGKCTGTAMNLNGQFVDYDPIGSWSECNLGAGYSNPAGVCCIAKQTHLHPADKCGIRNYDIDQRIQSNPYADNEAAFGEFPWQAIIFFQNYTFKCGATLISNKHAITAAHCVDKGMTADQIRLRFGEWQVNSFDEPLPYEDRNVYGIYIHPAYNPRNVHNDIAVLELVEPIPLNYHINSVCMPPYGYTFAPGTRCFTSGWGKDSFEGNFQHILKKIDVPFVEHSYCQELMRKTRLGKWFRLDKSFMCAGGEANKDACYGDGGGPLVCKDPATQQYLLAGITSWGIGCGTQDVPGIYVDVGKFSQWVDEIVLGSPVKAEQNTAPLGYGK